MTVPKASALSSCALGRDPCPIQSLPLFAHVPAERWKRFQELISPHLYHRGNILFYQGNRPLGLYFICTGRVKLLKQGRQGHSQILRIAEAPDLLGDRAFFSQTLYAATGEVMEDATVCFLESQQFWDLFGQDPEVLRLLVQRFAKDLGHAENTMHCLATCTVKERSAAELLRARDAAKKNDFELGETRTELAQLLGTSPEAVSRALAEFTDKGWIAVDGRLIRVIDEPLLRQVACPHHQAAEAA